MNLVARATVRTARVNFRGPDRLDITRGTGSGDGLVFAPSWPLLRGALDERRASADATRDALSLPNEDEREDALDAARLRWDAAWLRYRAAYIEEMRASYRTHRAAWERVLSRESVTMVCYCTDALRCHRAIIGGVILPRLGAQYLGEVCW